VRDGMTKCVTHLRFCSPCGAWGSMAIDAHGLTVAVRGGWESNDAMTGGRVRLPWKFWERISTRIGRPTK